MIFKVIGYWWFVYFDLWLVNCVVWLMIGCFRWFVMIWMAWMMWIWGCEWLWAQVTEKQWIKSWKFLTWAETSTQVISSNSFCRIVGYSPNWLLYLRQEYQLSRWQNSQEPCSGTTFTTRYFVVQSSVWKTLAWKKTSKSIGVFFSDTIIWSHICFETSCCHCFWRSKIKYMGLSYIRPCGFGSNFRNVWSDFRF